MSATFDFSIFPILTTERLRLRSLLPSDAPRIMAIFGDERVLCFLNHQPTDSLEKAAGMIAWFQQIYAEQKAVQWAITLRKADDSTEANEEPGEMIGDCGCYGWDQENRRVDIGYHILPAYWGQGYATEAAQAIIRWAFDHLHVHRVQADCTEGNIASERVMLKCGFRPEGIWRESCWEHGRFVNIKQFGLLRHEFEA